MAGVVFRVHDPSIQLVAIAEVDEIGKTDMYRSTLLMDSRSKNSKRRRSKRVAWTVVGSCCLKRNGKVTPV